MIIMELFNSVFPLGRVKIYNLTSEICFKDSQGREVEVLMQQLDPLEKGIYGLAFYRGGSHDKTGDGDEFKIFATVIAAYKELNRINKPKALFFSANLEHGNRARLYSRLVDKFANDCKFKRIDKSEMDLDLRSVITSYDSDSEEVFVLVASNYMMGRDDNI